MDESFLKRPIPTDNPCRQVMTKTFNTDYDMAHDLLYLALHRSYLENHYAYVTHYTECLHRILKRKSAGYKTLLIPNN